MPTLRYPLEVEAGNDFVSITHNAYRTNQPIAGQEDSLNPDKAPANPPPEGNPILLYMPNSTPSISNSNSWGRQDSLGPLGNVTRGFATGLTGGVLNVGKKGPISAAKGIVDQAASLLNNYKGVDAIRQIAIGKIAEEFGISGVGALTQMQSGQVYNPNVELIYQSPALRSFSLDFLFIPKNRSEAEAMNNIIFEFKKWSAPSDNKTMLEVPHLWNVVYKSGVGNDKYMNKFKKCALTTIQVAHNPGTDMHSTFTDGVPVVTAMSLQFQEVDIILRQDHMRVEGQGY